MDSAIEILTQQVARAHGTLVSMCNSLDDDETSEHADDLMEYIASCQCILAVLQSGIMLGSFAADKDGDIAGVGENGIRAFFARKVLSTTLAALEMLGSNFACTTFVEYLEKFGERVGSYSDMAGFVQKLFALLDEVDMGRLASKADDDDADVGGDIMDMLAEIKGKEGGDD